jgi:hypothetical protein
MKFPQLPIGARFRYQGDIYCKSSPLAASGPDGAQRMIPRSATVDPLQEGDDAAAPPVGSPLQQALDDYHAQCLALLREAAESGPAALDALSRRLDQAHAALVAAVD